MLCIQFCFTTAHPVPQSQAPFLLWLLTFAQRARVSLEAPDDPPAKAAGEGRGRSSAARHPAAAGRPANVVFLIV